MNDNPNNLEQKKETVAEPVIIPVTEKKETEVLGGAETAPISAEEIVAQAEKEAAKAAADYDKKEAPVAPQQDRVQLVDTKPKLHAVQLGGVTMPTEKAGEVSENTEILEVVDDSVAPNSNVSANDKGPGKGSVFGMVILFVGLLALVIFLPEISAYIDTQKYLSQQPKEEKITTGILECTKEDSANTLDYSYTFSFGFSDSKLSRLKSVTEIRGDVSLDEAELDKIKMECDLLETIVSDLSGISVSCKLENGLVTKSQTFNFSSIVVDDAITAYIEAGGSYPFYRNGDNIDEIERELLSTNYHCKRTK